MCHVATPPAEQPEIFELRSDMEDDEYSVRMAACRAATTWFRLDLEDDDDDDDDDDHGGCQGWTSDPLMDWYHDLGQGLDWNQISSDDPVDMEKYHIRMVPAAGQLVVLDSGADISLLPYHLSGCKSLVAMQSWRMPKVNTSRPLEGDQPEWMECQGLNNDLVVIEDDFIVASAHSPPDLSWTFAA